MTIALLALAGQLGIYLATLITTRRRQEQLWNDAKLIRDCQAFKAATGWGTPNSVGATVGDLIRENKDYSVRLITYGEEIKELHEKINRLTQEAKATQYFETPPGWSTSHGAPVAFSPDRIYTTEPEVTINACGDPVIWESEVTNWPTVNVVKPEDGVLEAHPGCLGKFKVRLPQPLKAGNLLNADLTRWKVSDGFTNYVGRVLEDSDENNVTLCRFF